ncbi:pancreatic lipase-related protein 2-like [Hylaeus volcanicus]|uniref:pancreatic lipase-related protein 2-like n=1 Tax=Hylaeus volcanicus TaxID=313075 RepID=UPI0023B79AAB|nr:pancreatic lipase-related protein 2-like [Hylaeus volcanicus]
MVAPASLALIYPTLLTALMQANYTVFPDDNGVPYLIKLDDRPLSLDEINALSSDLDSITFNLFTRRNPTNGHSLSMNNPNTVSQSNWNANRPTILVTHGWKSSGDSKSCTLIRDAYLKAIDCNVIVMDWRNIAKNLIYSQVAKSVPLVAEHVTSFSSFLRSRMNLKASTTKMVGHSLGAHVMGLAARSLSKTGQVAEVIALDPAKPLFEQKGPGDRVDRSDAKNVQIIHTSAGKLGMDGAVGTSDFYANGGSKQPGCSSDLLGSCAHGRSYEYFSESITKPRGFPGTPRNGGGKMYMGGSTLSSGARGSYDFKTADQSPYALGG